MVSSYQTKNILFTFGYDFGFWDAENTYGVLDDAIALIKNKTNKFVF